MRHSLSLTLLYASVAALWIFGSDQLVLSLNLDPEASSRLQTVKGWAFVVATALLLFFLLRRLEAETTGNAVATTASHRLGADRAAGIAGDIDRDSRNARLSGGGSPFR